MVHTDLTEGLFYSTILPQEFSTFTAPRSFLQRRPGTMLNLIRNWCMFAIGGGICGTFCLEARGAVSGSYFCS